MALPTIALPILSRKKTTDATEIKTPTPNPSQSPSSFSDPSATGFEVIRGGGGVSTRDVQPGDIVTKTLRGGGISQRRSEQLRIAKATLERQRLSAFLELQRQQAERQKVAREKALAEAKELLKSENLRREAERRGITISQARAEAEAKVRKQTQAVTSAESLRGGERTRLQFQRALAKKTKTTSGEAVSRLRKGTAREKRVFKKTGVSLSSQRAGSNLISPQFRDPTKEGFIISTDGGSQFISPQGTTTNFDLIGGTTSSMFKGFNTGNLVFDSGDKKKFTIKDISENYTKRGTLSQPPKPIPKEAFPPPPLTVEISPQSFLKRQSLKQETRLLRGEKGLGLQFSELLVGGAVSVGGTLTLADQLITSPIKTTGNIIKIIPTIPQKLPQLSKTLEARPSFSLGFLLAEGLQAKAGGFAVSKLSDVTRFAITRLSPRYKPITIVGSRQIIKVPSKLKRGTFNIGIQERGLKKLSTPLKEQVKFAGKELDVISAQTLKTPFGKEGLVLDKVLTKELFFDPSGRVRISRLGLSPQPKAKLLDIFSGEATFVRGKKTILFGEKIPVEAFPSRLKDIQKSFSKGKSLTPKQLKRFVKFKSTPSGKLKPIGFISKEPEVIFPAGEIPKLEAKIGVTLIEGKPIQILRIGIKQPSERLKQLQKIGNIDDISKQFSKETGLSSSVLQPSRPLIPSGSISLSSLSRIGRLSRISTGKASKISPLRISKRGVSPKKVSPKVSKSMFRSPKKVSPLAKSPLGRSPLGKSPTGKSPILRLPIVTPPVKTPILKNLFRTPKRKRGKVFTIFVRRFGKFRPIGKTRKLRRAFNIGRGRVSRTLGASFKIKGRGKLNLGTPLGFRRSKKERGVFIEKRGRRLSTGSELREIFSFKRTSKRKRKK